MNKRLEKARHCDECGASVSTIGKGKHFKKKHPEYAFTMSKLGGQRRIVCVSCLNETKQVHVLDSYGDLVEHYRTVHMNTVKVAQSFFNYSSGICSKATIPQPVSKEKIAISCKTCDRENCFLARKSIRRFMVSLLGCNYWLNKNAGYIPAGDVPYKLEPAMVFTATNIPLNIARNKTPVGKGAFRLPKPPVK